MINSVKDESGLPSFDKKAIKNSFYTEFKERFQASDRPIPAEPKSCTPQGQFGDELDKEVTMEELDQIISEMKNGKAIALDSVSNEHVKAMRTLSRPYLFEFVNKCVTERKMPTELKKGRVSLIFKAEDRRIPKNYRPITMNSALSKVITRLINQRMTELLT